MSTEVKNKTKTRVVYDHAAAYYFLEKKSFFGWFRLYGTASRIKMDVCRLKEMYDKNGSFTEVIE